jgi:hypothetical protein
MPVKQEHIQLSPYFIDGIGDMVARHKGIEKCLVAHGGGIFPLCLNLACDGINQPDLIRLPTGPASLDPGACPGNQKWINQHKAEGKQYGSSHQEAGKAESRQQPGEKSSQEQGLDRP